MTHEPTVDSVLYKRHSINHVVLFYTALPCYFASLCLQATLRYTGAVTEQGKGGEMKQRLAWNNGEQRVS